MGSSSNSAAGLRPCLVAVTVAGFRSSWAGDAGFGALAWGRTWRVPSSGTAFPLPGARV